MNALRARRWWVFDMDGTLTVPVHDFDAIRRELGLPQGVGTLEGLAALPPEERERRRPLLDEIGWRYVALARPQPGAVELLALLAARGDRVGVATRNSRRNAEATLRRIGCDRWIGPDDLASRDDCAAKPAPEPILRLLAAWGGHASGAAVIGDSVYDLQAGRAAGAATVLLDPSGSADCRLLADCCVANLDDLRAMLLIH